MKKLFLFLLCTLMICTSLCPLFATVSSAEDDVTVLSYSLVERLFNASENSVTAVFKSSKGISLPYRMYVPKDYDPSKSYPVVLYFHGAGERGNDNTHIFRGGSILQRLLMPEERKNNPCIIIAPQCAANSQWVLSPWDPGTYDHTKIQVSPYMTAAEELLEDVIKNYSVDESRLYVSGISMGGFGTWDLISRKPNKFAAAIPVCGGIDESYMEGLKGMPIRTFHAADDPIVSCAGTVRANQLLKDHGDFLYTEYATGGHLIWDKAYGTGGLTTWLFAQKKVVDVGPPMPPTPSDEPTPSQTPAVSPSESPVVTPNESPVVTPNESPVVTPNQSPDESTASTPTSKTDPESSKSSVDADAPSEGTTVTSPDSGNTENQENDGDASIVPIVAAVVGVVVAVAAVVIVVVMILKKKKN